LVPVLPVVKGSPVGQTLFLTDLSTQAYAGQYHFGFSLSQAELPSAIMLFKRFRIIIAIFGDLKLRRLRERARVRLFEAIRFCTLRRNAIILSGDQAD
jgi:hypothetical protein